MSRTTLDVTTKAKPNDIINYISKIMCSNGFSEKTINNEQVWCKGDGVIIPLQCFSISFGQNTVNIQAWTKDAFLGESELSGFMSGLPKKKMREILYRMSSDIKSM